MPNTLTPEELNQNNSSMTPELKANDLIVKFAANAAGSTGEQVLINSTLSARVCVEEILNEQVRIDYLTPEAYDSQKQYWNEVLNHLK